MHADSGNGADGTDPTGSTTVSSGQWHFVAAAYDEAAATVSMYLDGNLIGSGSTETNFALTNMLDLGAFLDPIYQFKGSMDEARIQTGLASANWIATSYQTVASNGVLQNYSTVARQSPAISINSNANGGLITWPPSGVGFALYTTTNLASPVTWVPATNQITFSNNQWQVNLPSGTDSASFYRLQSQ
jgi:hypothetical protein